MKLINMINIKLNLLTKLQEVVEVLQYAVEQKEAYKELVDELKAELGDACTELDDVRQDHQVNETFKVFKLPNV